MDTPLVQLTSPESAGELYLVGFRLDPSAEAAEFYTLVGALAGREQPIAASGRILLFRSPAAAARALESSDNGLAALRPIPTEIELLCDIGEALHIANQQPADTDGILFEVIAVFDDLLREIQLSPPREFAAALARTAARLSHSPDLEGFLSPRTVTRQRLEDSLLWCLGALMAKSHWVE
jgi:hypothetical protein